MKLIFITVLEQSYFNYYILKMNCMSSNPQGIMNWNKMNDKDKSYLVKLLGVITASIITGIFTGIRYKASHDYTGISNGYLGLIIFLGISAILSYVIKIKFDLSEMTDIQIFRHGIMIGGISFLFFWTIIHNFIYFS